MYHMFIINQQAGCCKSAMPYSRSSYVVTLVGGLTKAKLRLISRTSQNVEPITHCNEV